MISSRLALRLAGLQVNSSLRAGNPDKAHRAASGKITQRMCLQRFLPYALRQQINVRRRRHAVGYNMLDAAGHHRQGDVKGVQAIAKTRGQVEH